jgi:hypothetical protein
VYKNIDGKKLLWLYKIDNIDEISIGSNKLRSLRYITSNDIKSIKEIVESLEVNTTTLFTNKIVVSYMESLHLHELTKQPYVSPSYNESLSLITEARLSKFNNFYNIIKYISSYYKDLNKNTSLITQYLFSTL